MVDAKVANQPDAVGVVSVNGAVGKERQRVGRPRELRPGGPHIRERAGLLLEGKGHVESESPIGAKAADDFLETVPRRGNRIVPDPLPGLGGEPSMDVRRLRMSDGVTRHRIPIEGLLHLSRPCPYPPASGLVRSTRPTHRGHVARGDAGAGPGCARGRYGRPPGPLGPVPASRRGAARHRGMDATPAESSIPARNVT